MKRTILYAAACVAAYMLAKEVPGHDPLLQDGADVGRRRLAAVLPPHPSAYRWSGRVRKAASGSADGLRKKGEYGGQQIAGRFFLQT